ncbi:MAG: hypothetical protein E7492_03555 [Ruminococcaceae bacterium]|nr:hypothetical protein [Oscillospiraceae bacterium]
MKKVLIAILSLSIVLAFTICSVKTSKVEIIEWAPSEMYTDEEIKDAIDAVCVDLATSGELNLKVSRMQVMMF